MKKTSIFLILILLLFSCDNTVGDLLEEFTRGNIICVKQNASGKNNGRGWKDAYPTLEQAVDNAKDGDEIWIAGDLSNTETSTIEIYNDIKIIGGFDDDDQLKSDRNENSMSDVIINWQISVQAGVNVEFENLNMRNTNNGSNILSIAQNSNVQIYYCKFSDNYANASGGAIYVDDSKVVIIGCIFENCRAGVTGGGDGGAIYATNAELSVKNCTFNENRANNNNGGGAIYASSVVLNIENCEFDANTATNNGGAIYLDTANLYILNCEFKGNNVSSSGGAIMIEGSNNNENCFIGDCLFYDNSTSINNGGAIMNNMNTSITKLYIINSSFHDNIAENNGGAIFASNIIGDMYIYNSIFYQNNKNGAPAGYNSLHYNVKNVYIRNSNFYSTPTFNAASNYEYTNVVLPPESSINPFISTDPASSNFLQLNTNTACYNGGYMGSIAGYSWPATDLAGNPRVVGTIDMGCFEIQ